MIRAWLIGLLAAALATAAAAAQDPHAGHTMPAPTADPHAGHRAAPPAADPHAGHAMPASPATTDPHAGHDMGASAPRATGAQLPVGDAPAPRPIADHAADRMFGPAAMVRARDILAREHGGEPASKLQADLLEWAPEDGAYGWEAEGRWGGDIHRLAFKTEGEGHRGEGVEAAEVQVLYSRAVGRYTDVQAGLRYDLEPRSRAYAALGVDSMLPYWFEAEGALFLSDRGDLLARLEGSYDLRLTQRLTLQPRAELEYAAQDIPETGTGSGLSTAELSLRLRYEIRREFAPYIGLSHEHAFGDTADFRRAGGEGRTTTRVVVGLRAWF